MKATASAKARASRPPLADRAQPWLLGALVALYVARPLWPSESAARSGDGLPLVLLALLLTLAWLTIGLLDGRLSARLAWIDAAVALLVSSEVLAALWSATHDAARPAFNMLWEWIGLGIGYFLARQLIPSAGRARAVIVVMVALAVAVSGHGLYQYFVSLPATRAAYQANPDALLRQEGMWFPPGSVERELFEQRLYSTEPPASFALANSLAGFLAPWLIATCAIACTLRAGMDPIRRTAIAASMSVLAIGTCLLLTKSRAACLASGAGIVASMLIVARYRRKAYSKIAAAGVVVLAIVLAAALSAGGLDWQVLAEAPKSLGYRWQYWQATLAMIADHPWLGVGPGNFGDHYTRYKLATASEEVADPHNFLLEIWATAGTGAVLAMLAFVVGIVWRPRPKRTSPEQETSTDKEADTSPYVIGGGFAGYLLALALPMVTGALIEVPLNIHTAAGEITVVALMTWLWQPWVQAGGLANWVPGVAALSLLLNLLAAGGISYPAVAGGFWLLAAMAVNLRQPTETRFLARPALLIGWAIVLALVATCYVTAYRPVVAAAGWMARSAADAARGDLDRAEQDLLNAARADRASAAPWVALSDLRWRLWLQRPSPRSFQNYEQALLRAVTARPYQVSLWLRLGDAYLSGYQTLKDRNYLDTAIDSYRQAVRLYPHHAREHAKLSLALAIAGRRETAEAEAAEAVRLDQATPHADQKLRPELRAELAGAGLAGGGRSP